MSYSGLNNGKTDFVTVMSYDDFAAIQDKMDQRRRKRRAKDRENKIIYFKHQRCLGAAILAIGSLIVGIGCGVDADRLQLFGAVVGVVGLYVMLTKQMILIDKYYLECQDRINDY